MDSARIFSDEPHHRPGPAGFTGRDRADLGASHFPGERDSRPPGTLPRSRVVALAALLAVGAVVLINSRSTHIALASTGLLCGVLLISLGRYTTSDPLWLAPALVMAETLPYTNLLPVDPESRWWLHYPLLFAFCLPAFPAAWRKWCLTERYFTSYLIYLGWAAVSAIYSLNPIISAGRLFPELLLFGALTLVALSTNSAVDVRTALWRFQIGCVVLLCLTAFAAVALPPHVFVEGRDPAVGIYPWVSDSSGLYRFEGVFNSPNAIGSLMLISVGLALYLWRAATPPQRIALAVIILAATIFGAMADSRSPAVSLLLGIGAYTVWKYRARGLTMCAVLALAGTLIYSALGATARLGISRNITTLTGRTAAWQFEIRKVKERPLTGYGYEVEGAIFQDPRFPNWDKFWNRGSNTPTHEGYLSIAIGLGVPALLFWLYIILRPWMMLFRRAGDPLNLLPLFFFVVLPLLLRGLAETGVGEVRGLEGLVFFFAWMIAERERLPALLASHDAAADSHSGVDFRRLFAGAMTGILALAFVVAVIVRPAFASDGHESTPYAATAPTDSPHFPTLPPHAALPSGPECAAQIPATSETIAGNRPFNRTRVTPGELAAFAANGYTFETLSSHAQYARITGDYVGSTDMIMRWVACKYGIDEKVVRGQAWQESYWQQWQVGDRRTTRDQCVHSGFATLWNNTISLVDGHEVLCPYCCYTSWSAWQTKVYYEWKTWPMIKNSTSFAGEYRFADTRTCMNGDWTPYFARRPAQPGHNTYAEDLAAYAHNPTRANLDTILWGCIGMHYSGGWYDAEAIRYIADIRGDIVHRRWLTPWLHVTGP